MRPTWPAPPFAGVLLAAILLVACGSSAPSSPSAGTMAPAPTPTGSAGGGGALLLSCDGGIAFAPAALDAPPGAEEGDGAEFDALRDALARFGSDMEGYLPASGWRLVARDASTILFLARAVDGGDPPWRQVTVDFRDGRWQAGGGGGCNLRAVVGPGVGVASWSLDPAFAVPGPADTQIHVQVWERACASGTPATGRVVGPVISYAADAVTITYGVLPLPEGGTCQSNPPTPVLLELAEPLGDRLLLDGGSFPAAPPSPAF